MLTYAHQSADLVGATPQNAQRTWRFTPQTGEVFVALTHTKKKKNDYGSLLKISEGQGPQGPDSPHPPGSVEDQKGPGLPG